jgi:hypothetical protein
MAGTDFIIWNGITKYAVNIYVYMYGYVCVCLHNPSLFGKTWW